MASSETRITNIRFDRWRGKEWKKIVILKGCHDVILLLYIISGSITSVNRCWYAIGVKYDKSWKLILLISAEGFI